MSIQETLAERQTTHGDFGEHARVTQNLKSMAHDGLNWREGRLSAAQMEAIDMILHKLGRVLAGDPDFHDHWHDICGYAKLVADKAVR